MVLSGGQRRCLPKNTKIYTKYGYKLIQDVKIGDLVKTNNGYRKVTNKWYNGKRKLIKITTNLGELYSTQEHVWAVAKNMYGDIQWIPTSQLQPQHTLILNKDVCRGRKFKLPKIKLNKDTLWLFGYILTDDSIYTKKHIQEYEQYQVAEYFLTHFKQPSQTIVVPQCIFEAKPKIKLMFLAGVLDASDQIYHQTSRQHKQLCLVSTRYHSFARDIQILYSSLGIPTKLSTQYPNKENKLTKYTVRTVSPVFDDKVAKLLKKYCVRASMYYTIYKWNKIEDELVFPRTLATTSKDKCKIWGDKNYISYTQAQKLGINNFIPAIVQKVEETNIIKDVYDLEVEKNHCFYADGVLTHNSSYLSLFSHNDEEMMKCKTGQWYKENPQRARANNSIVLLRDSTTFKDFEKIIQYTKEFGDPGFLWTDSTEMVINPCGEVGMYPRYRQYSGWAVCNLSTINCSNLRNEEDFYNRCKAAAIIGTLQAGFTDAGYLGKISQKIIEQEYLIGVSMTGMMENVEITLNPQIQQKGAHIIRDTNEDISKRINIGAAARTTLIKPDGNSGCFLGTSSSISPHHSKRFLRTVQANHLETSFQFFKQHNPQACEPSLNSATDTDQVIRFPIEIPDGAKTKNQLPAIEMLKIVQSTQENWVEYGKNPLLCIKPWLTHNVSNTIVVLPHEWDDVAKYIYDHKDSLAGITLVSTTCDKDFPQAPFTSVLNSREIIREYGDAAIWCSGLIELGLHAFDNNLWAACDALLDSQFGTKLSNGIFSNGIKHAQLLTASNKMRFIEKAKKFAEKYFDGNYKKLTYCLKDVHNWKLYCDIQEKLIAVDYTKMIEEQDNTNFDATSECSGKACEIR